MNPLPDLVDFALSDPQAEVRRSAAGGQRVIGFAQTDVPTELIAAAGGLAYRLPLEVGNDTALADRYLETSFSPTARALAGQWLDGSLDALDCIVLSRSNDSMQRLYYYACELQRRGILGGPRAVLYDVAKIPRMTSIRHTEAATADLARDLGTDAKALSGAIAERNRRRRLLDALASTRDSDAAPDGSLVERSFRAADLCPASAFDTSLEAWLGGERPRFEGPRVMLAGSAPPDDRLHAAIAAAGARVVDEFGDHSIRALGRPIADVEEPLLAIAHHYQQLNFGSRSFADRSLEFLERARRSRADGVVLWLIEEEETLVWDVPAMKRALGDDGIPLLLLTRRRWDAADGALDSIHSFSSTLEAQ